MNEETPNLPIEPDLEARIVALVLGEASDFETEELGRLIQSRPDLAAFKREMEFVSQMVGKVGHDELEAPDAIWQLPNQRKQAILDAIQGTVPAPNLFTATGSGEEWSKVNVNERGEKSISRKRPWMRILEAALAASILVVLIGLMLPNVQMSRETALGKGKAAIVDSHQVPRLTPLHASEPSPSVVYSYDESERGSSTGKVVAGVTPLAPKKDAGSPADSETEGIVPDEGTIQLGGVMRSIEKPSSGRLDSIKTPEESILKELSAKNAEVSSVDQENKLNFPASGRNLLSQKQPSLDSSHLDQVDLIPRERLDLHFEQSSDSSRGKGDEAENGQVLDGIGRFGSSKTGNPTLANKDRQDYLWAFDRTDDFDHAGQSVGGMGKGGMGGGMGGGIGMGGMGGMAGGIPDVNATDDLGGGGRGIQNEQALMEQLQQRGGNPGGGELDKAKMETAQTTPAEPGAAEFQEPNRRAEGKEESVGEAGGRVAREAQLGGLSASLKDSKEKTLSSPDTRYRIETRTRVVPITKSRTEKRSVINAQGELEIKEVQVPYTENVTQNYTVRVPYTEAPAGLNEANAANDSFSTFSLHVSDVSFKLAAAALARYEWPEPAKIRIEEFVNAFDYGDPLPCPNEKVACVVEQSIHPFLQQRNLLRVSMRTSAEGRAASTPLRLTLVLDNSGSMERIDRQRAVRSALSLLAQQLSPNDQITLISFARQPRLLAENVSGSELAKLLDLIGQVPSEGGTNMEAALRLAFEKAVSQQTEGVQNRIVLLTDGAVNLGNADPESLSRMVESMRTAGIAFDAAGISADGLNDEVLEALTRKGDGRYYLLDGDESSGGRFAQQIAGALRPSASNVKVQIEFNPQRVGRYKLLGFEKHILEKEDFRNDAVDAAELAAAEAGVAMYQFEAKADGEGDVGTVSVRFRDLTTGQMVEQRWPILYEANALRSDQATSSIRLATAAAMLAARLRGDALGETVDLKSLSQLVAQLSEQQQSDPRVQQLKLMIEQARQMSQR